MKQNEEEKITNKNLKNSQIEKTSKRKSQQG